jgi:hypothetical protein
MLYRTPKPRFLQESYGVTFQETAFFIATAVKLLQNINRLDYFAET